MSVSLIVVLSLAVAAYFVARSHRPQTLGADPALGNYESISPLGVAIAEGHREAVRGLIADGTDPNAPAIDDQPSLFVAVSRQRTSIAADLIEAGAAVDFSHPQLGSCMAMAIVNGDRATAELLLRAGAPIDLSNAGGARALGMAALLGKRELAEWLLANGASVDAPNLQGGTPLRAAAESGHAEIVRLLLANGAAPSPVDSFGKTPNDYAREGGHVMVTGILEETSMEPSEPRAALEPSFVTMLPARQDATLKAMKEALEQGLSPTRAGASSLEAPSVIAAVRAVVGPSFEVAFSVDEEPDPRLPVRGVDVALWTYGEPGWLGLEARPALPLPPESIVEQVSSVAEYPYVLSVWSRAAAEVAQRLRPEDLKRVLAVMVYPPYGPGYIEPWDWHFRVQVAAALVASHFDGGLNALEDVLDGPVDWTTTAAVIALLDVARRDETARPVVVEALLRCARRPMFPAVYQHAIRPAARALLDILGVSDEVATEMQRLLDLASQ